MVTGFPIGLTADAWANTGWLVSNRSRAATAKLNAMARRRKEKGFMRKISQAQAAIRSAIFPKAILHSRVPGSSDAWLPSTGQEECMPAGQHAHKLTPATWGAQSYTL